MKSNKIITNFLCLSMVLLLGQSSMAMDSMIGKKIIKPLGKINYQGKSYKADLVSSEIFRIDYRPIELKFIEVKKIGVLVHGLRMGFDQVVPVVEIGIGSNDESIICRNLTNNKSIYSAILDGESNFNFSNLMAVFTKDSRIQLVEKSSLKNVLHSEIGSLRCYDYDFLQRSRSDQHAG